LCVFAATAPSRGAVSRLPAGSFASSFGGGRAQGVFSSVSD